MTPDKKTIRTIMLLITFTVLLYTLVQHLGAFYGAIQSVWNVFGCVIGGLAIAFVLNVPMRIFENRVLYDMSEHRSPVVRKLRRPLSIACSVLLAVGLVALVLVVVIPQLSKTFAVIGDKLPKYIASFIDWVEATLASFNLSASGLSELTIDWDETFSALLSYLKAGDSGFLSTATNVGTTVVSSVIDFLLSLIIGLYILAQKERIGAFTRRFILAFLPEHTAKWIFRIASMSAEAFSSFISGQLADSFILGVLCYFGMLIFGFPYPEVIAVVITVTSLVPMVGSFIGELIGAFLILFVSPLKALLFIVFILCLQQVEGSFIYPRVVGKSVGLPGVIVLCSVIVGGNIAGVAGALLAVPLCAVLYTLLREAMDRRLAAKAAAAAAPGE